MIPTRCINKSKFSFVFAEIASELSCLGINVISDILSILL